MRDGYAVNGDLRMYYQVHGTPTDRTPLLLIHGGGGTIETNWGALLPSFAAEREVVAVEEEGHGRTRPVDREHNLDAAVQDVVAVLDELGLPAIDVLAFSAGTLTAIAMALANPRRVGRMILASTPWRRDALIEGFWDGFERATLDSMPQLFRTSTCGSIRAASTCRRSSISTFTGYATWRGGPTRTCGASTRRRSSSPPTRTW